MAPPSGSPFADGAPPRGSDQKPSTPVESRERDIRRLEVLQKLVERMAGGTLDQLADSYRPILDAPSGPNPLTPERRAEILDEFERTLLERLGPLVCSVYEAQLKMGSLEAARDLGLSLGILKRPPASPKVAVTVNSPDQAPRPVNSIEDYRLERQSRSYRPPGTKPLAPRPGQRLITPGTD
jgi:hypothetical protein